VLPTAASATATAAVSKSLVLIGASFERMHRTSPRSVRRRFDGRKTRVKPLVLALAAAGEQERDGSGEEHGQLRSH
jgi:hypothetical protein